MSQSSLKTISATSNDFILAYFAGQLLGNLKLSDVLHGQVMLDELQVALEDSFDYEFASEFVDDIASTIGGVNDMDFLTHLAHLGNLDAFSVLLLRQLEPQEIEQYDVDSKLAAISTYVGLFDLALTARTFDKYAACAKAQYGIDLSGLTYLDEGNDAKQRLALGVLKGEIVGSDPSDPDLLDLLDDYYAEARGGLHNQ